MQLCIENVDQAGGCAYGYSCVYTDSISWASPEQPLPMIRDPRVGVRPAVRRRRDARGARGQRRTRRPAASSTGSPARSAAAADAISAPPTAPASTTTSTTSARSSAASRRSRRTTPAASSASCRRRRSACPTRSTSTCKLMFDLQALAFAVGHHARVLVQAEPRRLEPRVSRRAASTTASTPRRTTRRTEERILRLREDQPYHVSLLPYFLDKLKNTPDGDGNLLDNTLVIYGSPMGDSNVHNHKRCPLFLAGHAGGAAARATCTSRRPTARRWPTRCWRCCTTLGLDDLTVVRRQHRRRSI